MSAKADTTNLKTGIATMATASQITHIGTNIPQLSPAPAPTSKVPHALASPSPSPELPRS